MYTEMLLTQIKSVIIITKAYNIQFFYVYMYVTHTTLSVCYVFDYEDCVVVCINV